MRYYSAEITKPNGAPFLFKSLGGLGLTSLLPNGPQSPLNGRTNPAALNVEIDAAVFNAADPDTNSGYFRIWGLGVQDIGSASNLNGCSISLSAGMAKGLPLANPKQAGVILQGTIFQAWGNWIGTDQTIDMNFIPCGGSVIGTGVGASLSASNFPFVWQPGTPLSDAIKQTLSTALPALSQTITISPKLVTNHTVTGHYTSLESFSQFIRGFTQGMLGGNYNGVLITTNGTTIVVADGTAAASSVKAIAYTDLIGQPTLIGPGQISVKTVMRADIHVLDTVSLPPSLITQTSQSLLSFQDSTTFSGNFMVQQVHHYGNFRQASAEAWNTTFQMVPASS